MRGGVIDNGVLGALFSLLLVAWFFFFLLWLAWLAGVGVLFPFLLFVFCPRFVCSVITVFVVVLTCGCVLRL